ncbi:MAG: extracellular solute-binding protein [candidate division WS1 bacterium]|nr:extracellular solute-binding protein [candidate division WS1 bacterium]
MSHTEGHNRCSLRLLPATGALLVACLLGGCPQPQEAPIRVSVRNTTAPAPVDHKQIEELARAEGELAWYTSVPEAEARAILDAFMEQYPFVRARVVRGGSFNIAEQVRGEITAGRVQADVLHVLDPAIFVHLHAQGALMHYDSPEARVIAREYKDSGYWTALRAVTLCLVYDPRRVKGDRAPQHWDDLLRSSWRKRVGIKDTQTAGSGYAFYYIIRERYGTIYWERLTAQDLQVYQTSQQMLTALQEGEVDALAGMVDYAAYAAQRDGQPLEIVFPSEGTPVVIGPVAILAGAPHPNCARLFVDYCLGQTGQKLIMQKLEGYSVRPDIPPPAGQEALNALHLLAPSAGWVDYASKLELVQQESAELLGLGTE